MARQLWSSLRSTAVTHRASHLTRSRRQKRLFDTGSTFVPHVKKVLKFLIKGEARSLKEKH